MTRLTDLLEGALMPLVPAAVGRKLNRNSATQMQLLWTQAAYDKNPERYKKARAISPIIVTQNFLLGIATEIFTLDLVARTLRDSKLEEKDLIPLGLAYALRTWVYNHEKRFYKQAKAKLDEIDSPEVKERMKVYDSYWRQRA